MTRVYAYFALDGDFDPGEATRALGVEPTRTWRRGDPRIPGAVVVHKSDGWAFGTEEEQGLDLPSHVDEVLNRLHPLANHVNDLRQRLGLEASLECVAYVTRQTPITSLSHASLSKIVDLGASLDFDLIPIALSEEPA